MPFLVLTLVALFGLGFIGLLFGVARSAPPYQEQGDTLRFRHGVLLRGFALGVFFAAPILLDVWLMVYPPRSNTTLLPLVATVAVLGIAGFLLVWEAFRFGLATSPTGLSCRSPWRGSFTHSWSEVTGVEYSSINSWYIVTFQNGTRFHVSSLVPGVMRFVEACQKHLPAERVHSLKSSRHR